MDNLSFEVVSRLLRYEPASGKLYWLARAEDLCESAHSSKIWNSKFAGKEAFTAVGSEGYKCGKIYNKQYRAHRVAWLLHYGAWPMDQIDHINGDRADNRLNNLREVTNAQNAKNQRRSARNKSGVLGVELRNDTKKWRAVISLHGSKLSLGSFDTFEAAKAARLEAEALYGFHKNHGSCPRAPV